MRIRALWVDAMDLNDFPSAPAIIRRMQRPFRLAQCAAALALIPLVWGTPRVLLAGALAAATLAFFAECICGVRLLRFRRRLDAADLRLCPDCGEPLKSARGREDCACGAHRRAADVEKLWRQALADRML